MKLWRNFEPPDAVFVLAKPPCRGRLCTGRGGRGRGGVFGRVRSQGQVRQATERRRRRRHEILRPPLPGATQLRLLGIARQGGISSTARAGPSHPSTRPAVGAVQDGSPARAQGGATSNAAGRMGGRAPSDTHSAARPAMQPSGMPAACGCAAQGLDVRGLFGPASGHFWGRSGSPGNARRPGGGAHAENRLCFF